MMPRTTRTTTRAGVSASELPLQARLRFEHAGQWVAWTEDGQQIVAAGDDYETVRSAAKRAGAERAICEWLPLLDEARSTGGA